MKQYGQLNSALQKLRVMVDRNNISDARRPQIEYYGKLINRLLPMFYAETNQHHKLFHLGALLALTRIHHKHVFSALSRNNSNISYFRSFVYSSDGDIYVKNLKTIMDKIETVLLLNLNDNSGSSFSLPFKEAISLVNPASATELPNSVLELEKRLFFVGIYDTCLKNVTDTAKSTLIKFYSINGAVFAMLGPFAGVLSTLTYSAVFIDWGQIVKDSDELNNTQYSEVLTKWRKDAHEMLTSSRANEAADKLFVSPFGEANHEIITRLSALDIKIEEIENIWPRDQHSSMYCPVSNEFLIDPVILGGTGHTYNRAFIEKELQMKPNTDPFTGLSITSTSLASNHLVKDMITEKIADYEKSRSRVNMSAAIS